MIKLFLSPLGRLRLIGFVEGASLLLLVFFAMPLKYFFDNAHWVETIGPIHGALFLFYLIQTMQFAMAGKRQNRKLVWQAFAASCLPFGTFYFDKTILRKLPEGEEV